MCGRYFFELRELPAFARLKHKIEQQALFELPERKYFPAIRRWYSSTDRRIFRWM